MFGLFFGVIVVVVVVVVVVFFKQTQLTKTLCETLESRTLLVWPFSCFCWLVGRSIDDWFETDFLLFFYVILCSEYKNTWFVLTCTRRDDGVHHHHYLCWRRENIWLIDSRLFIKSKKKISEMIPIDFHSIILFWWRWVVCVIRVGYYKNFLFSFFFFKQLLYWPSKNNWKTLTHTHTLNIKYLRSKLNFLFFHHHAMHAIMKKNISSFSVIFCIINRFLIIKQCQIRLIFFLSFPFLIIDIVCVFYLWFDPINTISVLMLHANDYYNNIDNLDNNSILFIIWTWYPFCKKWLDFCFVLIKFHLKIWKFSSVERKLSFSIIFPSSSLWSLAEIEKIKI